MAPAEPRGGFTLIELLVALVISGILATAIFQVLAAQARFTRMQTAREQVQQNARAALEIITAELRAAPPSAFVMAARDSVRFYVPRAWGVICDNVGSGATTAGVRFPAGTFPADYPTNEKPGTAWGVAFAQTADPAVPPASWQIRAPAKIESAGSCGSTSIGAATGAVDERRFTVPTPWVSATGAAIAAGSQAFVFEETKYDSGKSAATGPKVRWIRRMIGYNGADPAQQPLAGPLHPDSGLVFRYYTSDGTLLNPTAAPLTPEQRLAIARVRVSVNTVSEASVNGAPQDSRASTLLYLRN